MLGLSVGQLRLTVAQAAWLRCSHVVGGPNSLPYASAVAPFLHNPGTGARAWDQAFMA
jgi:hypothetical protein